MQINGQLTGTLERTEDGGVIDKREYNTRFWIDENSKVPAKRQLEKLMRARGFHDEVHGGWTIRWNFEVESYGQTSTTSA